MGQVFSLTSFTNSRHFIKDAVGIEENASAVISLLDSGPCDDVRVIGLYGIEGIGKTTLAKLVCSRIYFKFEGVSFLENIRDAKQECIVAFQKALLDDVSKVKRSALHDRDYNRNLRLIRDRLCRMKILLVLDNVEEKVQVSLLGGRGGSLGPGSRILVTTRNEELLDQLRVDCKFAVSRLGLEESYQLFSCHAFDGDDEEEGRRELSKKLVYYTRGIPSAIEALGTCLFGKTKDQWGRLLEKLARHPEPDCIEAYSRNLDLFLLPYESKVEPSCPPCCPKPKPPCRPPCCPEPEPPCHPCCPEPEPPGDRCCPSPSPSPCPPSGRCCPEPEPPLLPEPEPEPSEPLLQPQA